MLYVNTGSGPRRTLSAHDTPGTDAVWIDLFDPTDEERAVVERATGLLVPARADIEEIESSSRLSQEGQTLYLSTPMTYPHADGDPGTAPIGFVLASDRLITVRFAHFTVFDQFAERFAVSPGDRSADAFIGLLETSVDRLADVLEHIGGDLDRISRGVFTQKSAGFARQDAQLRRTLSAVGNAGERVSNIRDGLLGIRRIAPYVHDTAADWFPHELLPRLDTVERDVMSLSDYDTQLTEKVQFLLDATLGFINIEQNNGIKVLTVVTIVGIPPTLIASMYGMNFKNMPEYDWSFGYQYGLTLIVLSAVLPLVWFKIKGWV